VRPSKTEWYLNIAEQVALRSTCLRRNYGAVIVKQDEILSTGYGGAPRGTVNCVAIGYCYRDRVGARKGEHYELCRAVHAEQNAIIQARRLDMLGATLYLVGLDGKTKERQLEAEPCRMCKRTIINAGIERVLVGVSRDETASYLVEDWVKNSLWEFRQEGDKQVPVEPPLSLGDPTDKKRRERLISQFPLVDAVVVQTSSFENPKQTIGRAAARFFVSNVASGSSVALSCGDTILSMLESLPYQAHRTLTIRQLSVEGDPATIHQAPATLVGLLRGKCSSESEAYGLQLPPRDLTPLSAQLRREIVKSEFLAGLRNKVLRSDYAFIGVGSADERSISFWSVAETATGGKFSDYVKSLGIAGEINNQVFDDHGNDCTDRIPELSEYLVNILSLDDIRALAGNCPKQKVVMVATGEEKTRAMRVALKAGFANVLITGSQDADRLLKEA
jgi:dCMP deaminase